MFYMDKKNNSLDPWFVTGFCEANALFTYSKYSNGLNLYFALKFAKNNESLVDQILCFFSAGKIYKKSEKTMQYRISKIEEIGEVIRHFDLYPLVGQQFNRYSVWRQMFVIKRDYNMSQKNTLFSLADELSGLS